jgi:hypothetical protein
MGNVYDSLNHWLFKIFLKFPTPQWTTRSSINIKRESQWPSGLWRMSAADHLMGLRFRIPPGAWMSVSYECRVLSWSIPSAQEFYRLWCVIVCDLETSRMRLPWTAMGCCVRGNQYWRNQYNNLDCPFNLNPTVLHTIPAPTDHGVIRLSLKPHVSQWGHRKKHPRRPQRIYLTYGIIGSEE